MTVTQRLKLDAADHDERTLRTELAERIAELPLQHVCDHGGTPVNASVNLHNVQRDEGTIHAQVDVIFFERFPLGCSNALQEHPRRALFDMNLDRATNLCIFCTRQDEEPEL